MMVRKIALSIAVVFATCHRPGQASLNARGQTLPFAQANVHFEQNITDGDVEVVFEIKAGDDGLTRLAVISPDGRTVLDFRAPDHSSLGIRQFRFESPEPGDIEALKSAYPEGNYSFEGESTSGEKFASQARLSHALPGRPKLLYPDDTSEPVSAQKLKIAWTAPGDLAACILYIEQDALQLQLTVKLPASITSFKVPAGFLAPGREYQLGLGTVSPEGNISFVEAYFRTITEK